MDSYNQYLKKLPPRSLQELIIFSFLKFLKDETLFEPTWWAGDFAKRARIITQLVEVIKDDIQKPASALIVEARKHSIIDQLKWDENNPTQIGVYFEKLLNKIAEDSKDFVQQQA